MRTRSSQRCRRTGHLSPAISAAARTEPARPRHPGVRTLARPADPAQVRALQNDGGQVIDVRPVPAYAPVTSRARPSAARRVRDLAGLAVPDPAALLVIVADPGQDLDEISWQALKIGYGNLADAGRMACPPGSRRAAGRGHPAAHPRPGSGRRHDVRQAGGYAAGTARRPQHRVGALGLPGRRRGGAPRRDHVRTRGAPPPPPACWSAGTPPGGPAWRPAGLGGRHWAGWRAPRDLPACPRRRMAARPRRRSPPGGGCGWACGPTWPSSLLVAVNALVGGTLGQERTVVPCWPSRPSTWPRSKRADVHPGVRRGQGRHQFFV